MGFLVGREFPAHKHGMVYGEVHAAGIASGMRGLGEVVAMTQQTRQKAKSGESNLRLAVKIFQYRAPQQGLD
jgi:hypothetical protein